MICWYVDNKKVSHINPKVNTIIIEAIEKHLGDLVITRAKNHTLLHMDIELLDDNKLEISMKSHIQEAIILFWWGRVHKVIVSRRKKST